MENQRATRRLSVFGKGFCDERTVTDRNKSVTSWNARWRNKNGIFQVSNRSTLIRFGYLFAVTILVQSFSAQASSLQAPRFITQPSSSGTMATEGQIKILQCQAMGVPQPDYRWLKEGRYLGEFTNEHFYRIQGIRRQDGGEYRCIARNAVGSIFSERAKVTVAYMSSPTSRRNKTISAKRGDVVILNLPTIDSQPAPSVQWLRDNSPVFGIKYVNTVGDNSLVILSVDSTDSGTYRAQITNTQVGQEDYSASYRLQVSEEPAGSEDAGHGLKIVVSPRSTEAIKGAPAATLECIANGRALGRIQTLWKKDGIPVDRAEISYAMSDLWNRTLTLQNVDPSHGGLYECQVRLLDDVTVQAFARANVTVLEKPHMESGFPSEVEVEYGRGLTINCPAEGRPPPDIRWFRNTVRIGTDVGGRFTVAGNGSLVAIDLQITDSGMFQCVASNVAGEATAYTWLRVKTSKPVMKSRPKNATVYDGKDVQLQCEVDGAPKPNTTWLHGDTVIESEGRIQILDSGTLLIAAAQPQDEGSYTCVHSNVEGSVSATAYLVVKVKTQITQPPVNTSAILGSTATLQCKISSDPSVEYKLKWIFQGQQLLSNGNGRYTIDGDGTLEIREVRNTDIGVYSCVVTSHGGNDSRTAQLEVVELPYPPTTVSAQLIAQLPKNVNVSWAAGFNGNSPVQKFIVQKRVMNGLVKASAAAAYPTKQLVVRSDTTSAEPLTDWQPALSNATSTQRFAILPNLKPALSYQFRVIAVNGVGEGNPSEASNIVTLPQEPPSGPPLHVVGSPRSSNSIMVQWQPPPLEDRNGELRGYLVRYRLSSYPQNTWSYRNITTEAQRSYSIDNLITWREYDIQISSYNDKGVGAYSQSIKARTKEGLPLAAPTEVRVAAVNSTAIKVSWKPPDPQKINGVNQGYKLQAWKGNPDNRSKPYKTFSVPPSAFDPLAEQEAIMTGLEKFQEYNVTVLCFTNPGDGKRSVPEYVRTAEDVPDAVGNFTIDDVKDKTVHVHWSPPLKSNGRLLGYILQFGIRDEVNSQVKRNLSVNTLELIVDNLRPTTYYTFEIFAYTAVGAGPSKVSAILSGIPPVLPHAPTKLAVSNILPFSVLLQFTLDFDGNASISKWTVEAQAGRNVTWGTVYETSAFGDQRSFVVRNLVPFMEYRLRLIANNIVGSSLPSEPSRPFQTLQSPPHRPPQSVTVRAMSANAIRARWTPLPQLEWYGIPRGYNISYRRRNGDEPYSSLMVENHNANSFVIDNLQEFTEYEVFMEAYNDVGSSSRSVVAVERTREAAPSSGPVDVEANATSSTTIVVEWGEVAEADRNGILEGYKVYYGARGVPFQYQVIDKNTTMATTLTRLRKYVLYSIQVLAYTRIGDGPLTPNPAQVTTLEDVPGSPSNVSFPDVSETMARIVWDPPEEPNGNIIEYRVTYGPNGTDGPFRSEILQESVRTYRATGLTGHRNYLFSVTGRTSLGWGRTVSAVVLTTNNREKPQPPSEPRISQSMIQSDQITFTWTPGRDGFAPLRYYTVQQLQEDGNWITIPEKVDPTLNSYTVNGLKPYTKYKFRLQSTNDIGPSGWSSESNFTRTLPAAPSTVPSDIVVLPITTTSVKITWKPLNAEKWNGDMKSGGYRIEYYQTVDFVSHLPKEEIYNPEATETTLRDLVKDKTYNIVLRAFNSQGDGPASVPYTVYVGEAVPTGEPLDVRAKTATSTSVQVDWQHPLESQMNGEIQGYKIFYVEASLSLEKEEVEVVPPTSVSLELLDLKKFTTYRIQVLAFNPAGDGPRSKHVEARTAEDVPGPPVNLKFTDITMTTLRVVWDKPLEPNGNVQGYMIEYETVLPNESFSKQVRQRVNGTQLTVYNLEEQATYSFSVMAQTIGFGPPAVGNVTTGPQTGAPGTPQTLTLVTTESSVTLKWENGAEGSGVINGYIVESIKENESRWQEVTRTSHGPMTQYTVSFQNLLPSTNYRFRLFAVNSFGISFPALAQDWISVPAKYVQDISLARIQPFFHEVWFLVTVAACSVVIIILVIAVLCVKSKSYKYKRRSSRSSTQSLTLPSSVTDEAQKIPQDDKLSVDDGGFATFELHQPRRGTLRKSTLTRKGFKGVNGKIKSPPRPSPRSVNYSDEEDLKGYGYDDNCDDSSLTEKPSEVSSSDSQASESDVESEKTDPHSFVNHYANVNDTLRQSWKKQKPTKVYTSYTDSEPEGSVAVSLNGGHIIMNNMAGSRAPLPGFSSFV